MSNYWVICGPCFPVFELNAGKYGPEITLYLDTFHAVDEWQNVKIFVGRNFWGIFFYKRQFTHVIFLNAIKPIIKICKYGNMQLDMAL